MKHTFIPLRSVEQALKLAKSEAKAKRTLNECLREIDRDDPLRDKVLELYRDAKTLGAFGVFFSARALGRPA